MEQPSKETLQQFATTVASMRGLQFFPKIGKEKIEQFKNDLQSMHTMQLLYSDPVPASDVVGVLTHLNNRLYNHFIIIHRMLKEANGPPDNGHADLGTRLVLYFDSKGNLIFPDNNCFTSITNIEDKYWLYADCYLPVVGYHANETEFERALDSLTKTVSYRSNPLLNHYLRTIHWREKRGEEFNYSVKISKDAYMEKKGLLQWGWKVNNANCQKLLLNRGGKKKTRKVASINKKDVLGKQRNVYKFVGNKKEYIKYKNEFILLKKYKEIHKKKTKAKK